MKIGVMGASLDGESLIKTKIDVISEILSKAETFIMGPNEDGLLKNVKEYLLNKNKKIIIYGLEGDDKNLYTEKYYVKTVLERITSLYQNSDIILFLPGGLGTRAELYTMLDSVIEEESNKRIIIYNEFKEFDLLLQDLNDAKNKNYIADDYTNYFTVVNSEEELKEELWKN